MSAPTPGDVPPTGISYEILVNGQRLSDTIQLLSIDLSHRLGQAPSARLTMIDGDPASGGFPISESSTFPAGGNLSIALGHGARNSPIFTGYVRGMQIKVAPGGGGLLKITAGGDAPAGTPEERQAAALRSAASPPAPVLTLEYGDTLQELDLTVEASAVGGWGPPESSIGWAACQGNALATPGATVTLAGLGPKFNGVVFIFGAYHHVAEGQWTTRIDIGALSPQ